MRSTYIYYSEEYTYDYDENNYDIGFIFDRRNWNGEVPAYVDNEKFLGFCVADEPDMSNKQSIKTLKENLTIPVIGNGDIKSCFDAKAMMDITGCDAVMIGRGVLGYPWLIKECVDYLDKGILPTEIANIERIDMLKKHIDLLIKNKGEKFAIPKMRAHAAYYLKKMPKNIDLKQRIFQMNNREELFDLFEEYIEFLDNIE